LDILLLYFHITHIGKWSSEAYTVVHNCSNSSKGVAQAQIEGRIQSNIYANIYFIIQNYGVSHYYKFLRISLQMFLVYKLIKIN